MEGRATHPAIPAAVSPQLILTKRRGDLTPPSPLRSHVPQRAALGKGRRQCPAPLRRPTLEQPRVRGTAAEPGGPHSPGRGISFVPHRLLGLEPRPLCAVLCFAPQFFGLGSGTETASMAMYLLPSFGGCLHQCAI